MPANDDVIFLNSVIRSVITNANGGVDADGNGYFNFSQRGINLRERGEDKKGAKRGALGETRVRVRYDRDEIDVYLFVRVNDLYILGYQPVTGTVRYTSDQDGNAIAQGWPSLQLIGDGNKLKGLEKGSRPSETLGYGGSYKELKWDGGETYCRADDIRSALIKATKGEKLKASEFRHLAFLMEACRFGEFADKILKNEKITHRDVKVANYPNPRVLRGENNSARAGG